MGLHFDNGILGGFKYALFNMGNGSIYASTGISSITRNTTATYTINFGTPGFDAQAYAVTAMGQYEWSYGGKNQSSSDFSNSSCAIRHGRYGTGVGGEISYSAVMILGNA